MRITQRLHYIKTPKSGILACAVLTPDEFVKRASEIAHLASAYPQLFVHPHAVTLSVVDADAFAQRIHEHPALNDLHKLLLDERKETGADDAGTDDGSFAR